MGRLSPAGCVGSRYLWAFEELISSTLPAALLQEYVGSLESAGKGLDNEGLFFRHSFLSSSFSSVAYLLAALCDFYYWPLQKDLPHLQDLQQHFCKENLQHTVYLQLSCN